MKTTRKLIIFIFTFLVMTASAYAADDSALFAAIKEWNMGTVEALLAGGANVNARNEYGETPLHMAAFSGSYDIAELLLAKGADISARTDSGSFTVLYYAVDSGSYDIAELLLSKGADVNATDGAGKVPMDIVTERLRYLNLMAGLLEAYMAK